jgi:hypothetical protein
MRKLLKMKEQDDLSDILAQAVDFPAEWARPNQQEVYRDAVPSFNDGLILEYNIFQDSVYKPLRVLYPSCDLDASPVRGFPDSEVVLVDINQYAVEALKRNGINAVHSDIRKYNPEKPFNLVVLLNPCIDSSDATQFLAQRGYVLANNWHGNAVELSEDEGFENVGTIYRVPIEKVNGFWQYEHEIVLGEMKDLGKVADNFWIFRRRE